ncbi:hypothetical protein JKG47_21395, partial [Acidithiobacillus sp. MC6.1]|nr:hypothetical protein [Acidithiobacillus sp. MC6.1]
MDKNAINEISTQRTYYTETARKYDSVHAEEGAIGLFFMLSAIDGALKTEVQHLWSKEAGGGIWAASIS